jgi:hypothetical protein
MLVKILGIGLPRTGTFSLATALAKLGFHTKHCPTKIEDIEKYDACTEVKFSPIELREKYPDCKLILTVRNIDQWLRSCQVHRKNYREGWNPFWLKPEQWIPLYNERLKSVEKLTDVLILDICNGHKL